MLTSRSIERAGPSGEDTRRHPESWYAATAPCPPAAKPLTEFVITDHCVIGGGYTGLGAARRLAQAGEQVHLIEAGPLGWGASGRNGGQVHIGWNKDQPWLEQHFGLPAARALWQVACDARAHLDTLLALDPDRCEFRPGLIHADHKRAFVAGTRAHVAHMRDTYGHDALRAVDGDEMRTLVASTGYFGGSVDESGGHLHPLKLALTMARAASAAGATLHPHSPCLSIERDGNWWRVTTPQGALRARKVLVATGGYGKGLVGGLDAHVLPINNYIATTAPLPPDVAQGLIASGRAVSDSRFVVYYFRVTADNRLLFGGGESYTYRMPADIAGFVRPHLLRVFPQLAGVPLEHAWGGTLAITPQRLPHVRQIQPGLWTCNGFSGVGVVLAPYLGAVLGEAMAGVESPALDRLLAMPAPRFPGGSLLRWPTMVAALSFFALRDRL